MSASAWRPLCVCVCLSKVFPLSVKFFWGCENIPSSGNAEALAHTCIHTHTHIHTEMCLNQPIRSSRGSLITKTGSLPCPNDGALTYNHTHTCTETRDALICMCGGIHSYIRTAHLETQARTHTTQTHEWPQLIMRPLIKKNDPLVTIYQRRMERKEEFGQKAARCGSVAAHTGSSWLQPPLFTSG